ncbi:MAG: hypothetical protein NTY19_06160 [Planctomycetota bacterium]|nr:hypothetical protein [Planctomycetota bacterium]
MRKITLFSFGYYGWGNATPKLIEAADAIERCRGFRPPIFVDIRIRRTVRASGFKGAAFAELVGDDRHQWMKSLGNKRIATKSGPRIQIAEPKAADDLLDLTIEAAQDDRRVIFFCSCGLPRICHRSVVANLVLAAARRRGTKLEIVEWPGGKPNQLEFDLAPAMFRSVINGRKRIPLPTGTELGELGGPPWGSVATFRNDDQKVHRLVGPASWHTGQWCLPVYWQFYDATAGLASYREKSRKLLKADGLGRRTSGGK